MKEFTVERRVNGHAVALPVRAANAAEAGRLADEQCARLAGREGRDRPQSRHLSQRPFEDLRLHLDGAARAPFETR